MSELTSLASHHPVAAGGVESMPGCAASGLVIGSDAPVFVLPDADMEMFDLRAELEKRAVVLGFYARDSMPSSQRLAIAYSDLDAEFEKAGAEVACVCLDDCLNHADFRDEHGLAIRLLADPEAEVCRLYGVVQQRETDGVTRTAIQRATFIIGRDGKVHHVLDDAGSRDHAANVLQLVRNLSRSINGNRQEHRRHA